MCPATTGIAISTWVIGAMTAASAVVSYQQAKKAADAQNDAAEDQYGVETGRAKDEAMDRQNQLQVETSVESSKFQQQREQLALEALREQSSQRAAGAESGLGGVSAIRSFLANELGEDAAQGDAERSNKFTQFNIQQRNRGINTALNDRTQDAATNFNRSTSAGPSKVGLALELGGAVSTSVVHQSNLNEAASNRKSMDANTAASKANTAARNKAARNRATNDAK